MITALAIWGVCTFLLLVWDLTSGDAGNGIFSGVFSAIFGAVMSPLLILFIVIVYLAMWGFYVAGWVDRRFRRGS